MCIRDSLRPVALYTSAGVFALFIHPSLDLLLGVSAAFLVVRAAREFLWRPGADRRGFLQTVLAAGLVLGCAALVNAKNPKYGDVYKRQAGTVTLAGTTRLAELLVRLTARPPADVKPFSVCLLYTSRQSRP